MQCCVAVRAACVARNKKQPNFEWKGGVWIVLFSEDTHLRTLTQQFCRQLYILAAVLSKSGDIYLVFQFTSLGVSS